MLWREENEISNQVISVFLDIWLTQYLSLKNISLAIFRVFLDIVQCGENHYHTFWTWNARSSQLVFIQRLLRGQFAIRLHCYTNYLVFFFIHFHPQLISGMFLFFKESFSRLWAFWSETLKLPVNMSFSDHIPKGQVKATLRNTLYSLNNGIHVHKLNQLHAAADEFFSFSYCVSHHF